ncbi:hypothetical protein [Klebsiella pneumoniae IS46]|nr:hypothetical protein [Klebsiella pneumoniae IS46]CDL48567.1 hypothetical protein [Klebsiella pneumoniae ISC21]
MIFVHEKKTEIPVWQAFREKDHKKRCTFPSGKKKFQE